MAGYYGTHDVIHFLFGTTKNTPQCSSETTSLTKQMKYDLRIAKEEASIRGLYQSYNWLVQYHCSNFLETKILMKGRTATAVAAPSMI